MTKPSPSAYMSAVVRKLIMIVIATLIEPLVDKERKHPAPDEGVDIVLEYRNKLIY